MLGYIVTTFFTNIMRILCYMDDIMDHQSIGVCTENKRAQDWSKAIQEAVFIAVDWMFASHYLNVATMFRITIDLFSNEDEKQEALEQLNKRKKLLYWLDIVLYASLLILFTMIDYVQIVYTTVSMWVIAIVSLKSMRHIQNVSKDIRKRHRLSANLNLWQSLTIFYLVCGLFQTV